MFYQAHKRLWVWIRYYLRTITSVNLIVLSITLHTVHTVHCLKYAENWYFHCQLLSLFIIFLTFK
nr:MAG TPA: hypothetical protein [Caudoviricetes sp.]